MLLILDSKLVFEIDVVKGQGHIQSVLLGLLQNTVFSLRLNFTIFLCRKFAAF